jgi:hypothetical protein
VAQRAGNSILTINPKLLIIVEGIKEGTDLSSAFEFPIELSVANKLVYSVHIYDSEQSTFQFGEYEALSYEYIL